MALKNRSQPPNTKGQVVFYTDREKEALKHIGNGSVAEGARVSIRWAAHFWNVGLRPDHNLNNVGICLFVDDEYADDL
jgi:hypothetical protein